MKLRNLLRCVLAAVVLYGAVALNRPVVVAQNANQTLVNLLATDLIQVYRFGTAAITYATYGMISAVTNTTKVAPGQAGLGGTGYSNTFGALQGFLVFRLPGTMPYSYVTLAAAPADGQRQCIFVSGGAITNLHLSANVGQSINNAVTTLANNTGACYTYSLSNTTWDRS